MPLAKKWLLLTLQEILTTSTQTIHHHKVESLGLLLLTEVYPMQLGLKSQCLHSM